MSNNLRDFYETALAAAPDQDDLFRLNQELRVVGEYVSAEANVQRPGKRYVQAARLPPDFSNLVIDAAHEASMALHGCQRWLHDCIRSRAVYDEDWEFPGGHTREPEELIGKSIFIDDSGPVRVVHSAPGIARLETPPDGRLSETLGRLKLRIDHAKGQLQAFETTWSRAFPPEAVDLITAGMSNADLVREFGTVSGMVHVQDGTDHRRKPLDPQDDQGHIAALRAELRSYRGLRSAVVTIGDADSAMALAVTSCEQGEEFKAAFPPGTESRKLAAAARNRLAELGVTLPRRSLRSRRGL